MKAFEKHSSPVKWIPRAIALDPRFDRTIVFQVAGQHREWPNGLTLDYVALCIYWVDARSDVIHTTKYDGSDHHEILRGHDLLTHPFGIALFENYVYWTDWRTNSVIRANKLNGTDVKVLQQAITQPFDIQIYQSSLQPLNNVTNGCEVDNGG
ncbi:low-density lipoprotein receptor-related protein 1-like protein, partial [Leptotrombidium deliense]